MEIVISGTTGMVHLVTSVIALITGADVLITKKGTQTHKRIGYIY